jgi:hypothetical protein
MGLAAMAALAACSAGTPAPAPSPTSVSPTGHGALAHCLTEHGMPAAPGPVNGPPPGVDQDSWHKAMQACSTLGPGPAG